MQQQTQPVGRLLAAAAAAQHLRSMSVVGAPVPILAAQVAAIPCCRVWLSAAGLLRCSSTAATAASVLVTGWQQGAQFRWPSSTRETYKRGDVVATNLLTHCRQGAPMAHGQQPTCSGRP
jgi:hypothetical protein